MARSIAQGTAHDWAQAVESAHDRARRTAAAPPLQPTPVAGLDRPGPGIPGRAPALAVAAGHRPRRGLAGAAPGRYPPARGASQHRVVLPGTVAAMARAVAARQFRRTGRGPVRIRPRLVGWPWPDPPQRSHRRPGTPARLAGTGPRRAAGLRPFHDPGNVRAAAVRPRAGVGHVPGAPQSGDGMGGQARPTALCRGDVRQRRHPRRGAPSQARRIPVVRTGPGHARQGHRVRAVLRRARVHHHRHPPAGAADRLRGGAVLPSPRRSPLRAAGGTATGQLPQ